MEYNDFNISSAEEFAKMAKEYSERIKREKLAVSADFDQKLFDEIYYIYIYLNWLYGYVKKNIRSNKLRLKFSEMEAEISSNTESFVSNYPMVSKPKITKPRRLNNLLSCIKLAIHTEAELIEKLLAFNACSFICAELENIKILSSI